MFRILFILGLVCAGNAIAADSDADLDRYRAYFKKLGLPYVQPRGCSADVPCSVAADFNDDGVRDLAALYEYSGDKPRYESWNLDLVILYSQKDSSEPAHVVFSHLGQVNAETGTSSSLAIQEKGLMKIPSREITLVRPGINVIYGQNTGADQFPTLYWRGGKFHAIDKSDD